MINYKNELQKQLKELDFLLDRAQKRKKQYKNLEKGKLQVTSSHGVPQYKFLAEDATHPKYIPSIEKERVKLFAQREYDEKVYELLTTMRGRLNRFINNYEADFLDTYYDSLCKARKHLITPIKPTREAMINAWMESHPGNLNTFETKPDCKTARGEYVRSKSEKIIADYLLSQGIPYQFEPPFRLFSGDTVFPDFVILNVRKNKTIYWEHLGKVGDLDYATKNFGKLMDYEQSGLILGDNLIVTLETKERQLDIELVEKKVQAFLL